MYLGGYGKYSQFFVTNRYLCLHSLSILGWKATLINGETNEQTDSEAYVIAPEFDPRNWDDYFAHGDKTSHIGLSPGEKGPCRIIKRKAPPDNCLHEAITDHLVSELGKIK